MSDQEKETTELNTQTKTIAVNVDEYSALNDKVKRYEIDMAHMQKKLQDLEALSKSKKDSSAKPDSENQLKDMQSQLDNLTAALAESKNKLVTKTIVSELKGRIADVFVPSAHDWVMRDVLNDVSLDGDDIEAPKFVIKGQDGNPRWSKVRQNERMGLDEYLEELRTRRPDFVATKIKAGEKDSGTQKKFDSGFNTKQLTATEFNSMSEEDVRRLAMTPEGLAQIKALAKQI